MPTYRIFHVEDHALIRQMVAELFAATDDLRVTGSARTAEEALDTFVSADFDLLLVDMSLPGMSGLELVHEAKRRWPTLPILVLSGHEERVYADRSREAGVEGYVVKGCPEVLEAEVRRVIADLEV